MAAPTPNNPKGEQKSPVMTPEVIQKLELAFSMGANQREACIHAGIREQTYSSWKMAKPELSENMERLRSKPALLAKFTLLRGLEADPNLALRYLERTSDEFRLKTENINTNITLNDVLGEFVDPRELENKGKEGTDEEKASDELPHQGQGG